MKELVTAMKEHFTKLEKELDTDMDTEVTVSHVDKIKYAPWTGYKKDGEFMKYDGGKFEVGDSLHSVSDGKGVYQKFTTADAITKFIGGCQKTELRFIMFGRNGKKKKVYLQKPRHDSHLPFEFEDEDEDDDDGASVVSVHKATDSGMDSGSE